MGAALSRLEREEALRERVTGLLERGLSPEQVAGRLRREAGATVLCHETIYRFIYAQVAAPRTTAGAGCCPADAPAGASARSGTPN